MIKIFFLIIALAGAGFLWWAFSPLLFDKEVHEELDVELQAQLDMQTKQENESDINTLPDAGVSDETSTPTEAPRVYTDGPFLIQDTAEHPASGNVELIYSPEETLIRYLDYEGTNGPDLYIYLAKDLEATEYIDLGLAKGNKGTLIYGVPMDVDLDDYKYVLTWCKAFGVLFDYAEIN